MEVEALDGRQLTRSHQQQIQARIRNNEGAHDGAFYVEAVEHDGVVEEAVEKDLVSVEPKNIGYFL